MGGRRSPVLAVIVVLAGLYLLWTMWADFRYWLVSDAEPEVLGHVRDIYREGSFVDDFDNRHVVVEGTPDVQHAARMKTKRGTFGYVRLLEAGGSLFAAVPREEERPPDHFPGRFQGRMRRLGATWNYEHVEQFFNDEQILYPLDVSSAELVRAVRDGTGAVRAEGSSEEIELDADDRITLVVRQPEVTVQLGRTTWRTAAEAEAALAGLGYPYAPWESKAAQFHAFVARIPEAARDKAQAGLNESRGATPGGSDPKVGALVLPRTATYVVAPGELSAGGDGSLSFSYGTNTTSPGYSVENGRLVERALPEGRLDVAVADLAAVRVERPIRVDPDGYVVLVDEIPSSHWLDALLFVVVLALVGVNAAVLAVAFRRSTAA